MSLVKQLCPQRGKDFLFLAVLVALFVSLFGTPINALTDHLIPRKVITISVEGSNDSGGEAWICNESGNNEREENYFSAIKAGEQSGSWEYRDMETYGYSCDVIVLHGDGAGSSITFSVPADVSNYICFEKNPGGPMLSIAVDDEECQIDLYSEQAEQLKFYPFSTSFTPIIAKILIYLVAYLLIFILLLVLLRVSKKILGLPFLSIHVRVRDIFFVWAALYIFAVVQYEVGIPNNLGLEVGDQGYYWSSWLLSLDQWWDPAVFASSGMHFRGYLCNLIPITSRLIGTKMGIDSFLIYFIFTSFAIAWLTAYVLPQFYELMTGQRARICQVIVFLAVYLFFWNGTLTNVLVDMFASVCFMSGIMFAEKFRKTHSLRTGCYVGFFWGIACNYRPAYQYGIYMILILSIIILIYTRIKRKSCFRTFIHQKRVIAGVLLLVFAFFIVSVPQIWINQLRGYADILPNDYVSRSGIWLPQTSEGPPRETSVLEASANMSLMYGYTGYPYIVSDAQMMTMKTQIYGGGEILTIPQIFDVYANSPIEALIYVAKKLILAFDVKTSSSYPKDINWRESSGLIFSFLNYFVLISALYTLYFDKKVQRNERLLFICFFASLILPPMFVHVEWRYFLSSYVYLYYIFSYHFVGKEIVCEEDCRQPIITSHPISFLAILFSAFLISLSIYP